MIQLSTRVQMKEKLATLGYHIASSNEHCSLHSKMQKLDYNCTQILVRDFNFGGLIVISNNKKMWYDCNDTTIHLRTIDVDKSTFNIRHNSGLGVVKTKFQEFYYLSTQGTRFVPSFCTSIINPNIF